MDVPTSYFVPAQAATAVLREKGSKFVAHAWPLRSEEEVKEKLTALRKEHPSASHHCYAWRLGADKRRYRSNDDGEPAGSAGKPILAAIQSRNLSDVLVVVVRWFGGTLLGTGGLIAAYRGVALAALEMAGTEQQFVTETYVVSFEAESTSAVMRVLRELDGEILSSGYTHRNLVTFRVKKQYEAQLIKKFDDLYAVDLKHNPS